MTNTNYELISKKYVNIPSLPYVIQTWGRDWEIYIQGDSKYFVQIAFGIRQQGIIRGTSVLNRNTEAHRGAVCHYINYVNWADGI